MPVEFERKYVLKDVKPLFADLRKKVISGDIGFSLLDFQQGYLDKNSRLRKINYLFCGGHNEPKEEITSDSEFVFTFKKNTGKKVIELEHDISSEDFHDLWPETKERLTKYRFHEDLPLIAQPTSLEIENHEIWEIDFFYDENKELYFAMAECELFNGRTKPVRMPDFVKRNLIYEVEMGDKRFTSRKLSKVDRAAKMYQNLLVGGKI